MNTGAFGEGFPYSNFHDLNMDWIIKIAKDFLDQYTNIQNTITEGSEALNNTIENGLTSLQETYDNLENLLNEWYRTHSQDIAEELANAIGNFQTTALEIAQNTIALIPTDYTALYNQVQTLEIKVKRSVVGLGVIIDLNTSTNIASITGTAIVANGHVYTFTQNYPLNIPTDSTNTYFIVADLSPNNSTCTFNIIQSPGTWTDNIVFIAHVQNTNIKPIPGIYAYRDSIREHGVYDTWTEYNQFMIMDALTGSEKMLIVDLINRTAKMPSGMTIVSDGKTITTTETTIDFSSITGNNIYIYYDKLNNSFNATGSTLNRNTCFIIAGIRINVNYVFSRIPCMIMTNPTKYYNVRHEMAILGDSIVAGYGGSLGFENILSGSFGIRLLNYGIGGTGYVKRVEVNTTHLVGNKDVKKGTNQVVDTEYNNVVDVLSRELSNITQDFVCFMAGRNDIAGGYTVSNVISAVESCITSVLTAGKIPVIISPIRSENVNMSALITALQTKCEEYGIPFINMYNIGIYPSSQANKTKYLPDGIHPSDAGYELIATMLSEELSKLTKRCIY